MPNLSIRWRSRPDIAPLEQELDRLRMDVIQLRRELSNKTGYAATLELVLKQRTQTIDNQQGTIDRLRALATRLDAEAEAYYQRLAAG